MPDQGICFFTFDGSPWPRPRAKTLDDWQYVFQASSDVIGGTIAVDYPYSSLNWVATPQQLGATVDERRVASNQIPQAVGALQIEDMAQSRAALLEVLDIVACDGKYGNAGFLRTGHGKRCGIVAGLRCDRVLYGPPPPRKPKQRGRNKLHSQRFAFKEPKTWFEPDEVIELDDPIGATCAWNAGTICT